MIGLFSRRFLPWVSLGRIFVRIFEWNEANYYFLFEAKCSGHCVLYLWKSWFIPWKILVSFWITVSRKLSGVRFFFCYLSKDRIFFFPWSWFCFWKLLQNLPVKHCNENKGHGDIQEHEIVYSAVSLIYSVNYTGLLLHLDRFSAVSDLLPLFSN